MATSPTYWDKRAVRRLTEAEKQGEAYSRRIQKIYDQANKNIQRDIENIYRNYSKATGLDTQSLKTLLSKTETDKLWDELKRKGLDKYVKGNYKARISRLEKLQAQIYAKAKEIYPKEQLEHTMCYNGVVNNSYYKAIYDTQMGTGFDFAFSNLDDNLVSAVLSESWSGANYSKRIWGNTDLLAQTVSEIVGGALLSGQSIEKTSRQIRERFNVGKYYADRLVRTECNHFHNEADAMAYEEMGVDKYVFMAVLDTRTSSICQNLDGEVIPLKEKQVGVNYPPMHPNCRSTTRAYMGEEIEKTLKRRARNPVTGENEVIDNMSYKEWAKQHGLDGSLYDNDTSAFNNDLQKLGNSGIIDTELTDDQYFAIETERERALNFADRVYFDGATNVDNLKTVNETMEHLTKEYPTEKLGLITVDDLDNSRAKANGGILRIDRTYINSTATPFDWEKQVRDDKAEITKLRKMLETADETKRAVIENEIKLIERDTKFKRLSMSHDVYGVKGTITHEYGHVIADQRIGLRNGDTAIVGRSTAKDATYATLREKVKTTYKTAHENGDIFNISRYADVNEREFFAEAFVMYDAGEKLPQYIVDMINEVLYV